MKKLDRFPYYIGIGNKKEKKELETLIRYGDALYQSWANDPTYIVILKIGDKRKRYRKGESGKIYYPLEEIE